MKILFLGANPLDRQQLAIHKELGNIQKEFEDIAHNENIEIIAVLEAQPQDLSGLLLKHRPDIVHFSGHGTLTVQPSSTNGTTRDFLPPPSEVEGRNENKGEGALVFVNDAGQSTIVSPQALTKLLQILDSPRCVVLNACFSAGQAEDLTKPVKCVIGMNERIDDRSAIAFATGFYQGLAHKMNVLEAFELGKNMIARCNLPGANLPQLYPNEIAASKIYFVTSAPADTNPPPPLPPPKPFPVYRLLGILALIVVGLVLFFIVGRPVQFESLAPDSPSIVVVGPGAFRADTQRLAESLCAELTRTAHEGVPQTVCRTRGWYGDDDETLRKKALEANAWVFVQVDEDGKARIYPLKSPENDGRVVNEDLTKSGAPEVIARNLHELVLPLKLPAIAEASGTVVVVGPGVLRSVEGQTLAENLCSALDRKAEGSEPRAICRARGFGDKLEVLRKQADTGKASVFVWVDKDGMAWAYPLGKLVKGGRLGQGLPKVNLTNSAAPDALAPVLRELARGADGSHENGFDAKRLLCGQSVAQMPSGVAKMPFGVALAILMLRIDLPNCSTLLGDWAELRPQCKREECSLLDLLSNTEASFKDCNGEADWAKKFVCLHQQAIRTCERGETKKAQQSVEFFDAVPNRLYGITAAEIAACLVANGKELSPEELDKLRARGDQSEPGCERPTCETLEGACGYCVSTIGTRAMYWGDAGDWVRAQRDYERAAKVSGDNEYLLGWVESRLHQFQAVTDEQLNKMVRPSESQKIRAALLRWVIAKRGGNATRIDAEEEAVIAAYGELPPRESVYERPRADGTCKVDKSARGLLCPTSAEKCRVYDLLAGQKSTDTADKLRKALRNAVLPTE